MPREEPNDGERTAGRKSIALSLRNVYETLAICWPTLLDAARGTLTKEICDERLAHWSPRLLENARAEIEVIGREHLDGRTFLVMSNHQSLYDIPVLFTVIGPNLRMITKKELFDVPVFGKALEVGGFIRIDRGDRQRAIESLEVAKETFARGTHVWIAPEGTRSQTGKLLPFKKGGFNLALQGRLPILPVTLRGTRDILRARGVRSVPGAMVTVTVHPPIDAGDYATNGASPGTGAWKAARDRLMQDVRSTLASGL